MVLAINATLLTHNKRLIQLLKIYFQIYCITLSHTIIILFVRTSSFYFHIVNGICLAVYSYFTILFCIQLFLIRRLRQETVSAVHQASQQIGGITLKKRTIALASLAMITSASVYSSIDKSEKKPEDTTSKITLVSNQIKSGWHDGYFYKAGKKFTGVKSGIYYKYGKKFTGKMGVKQFVNGKIHSGTFKGILYKDGYNYTGYSGGYYYQYGKKLTGRSEIIGYDSMGNESFTYFRKGLTVGKGYHDFYNEGIKKYYYKGVLANGFYNINGTERFFFKGLQAGTTTVEVQNIKYYLVNGTKYTGFVKSNNSNNRYFKKGILAKGMFKVGEHTYIANPDNGQIFTGHFVFEGVEYIANNSGVIY